VARVTVIVPTFNRAGYLAQTIASILDQDFGDFDLVVADNASTDATATLVSEIADPRLHHVRRAHDIGWRANFNQALHSAESEYVTLVGDDDRLLPGALTRAVSLLDNAPSVGFVHASFDVIDGSGDLIQADANWTNDVPRDWIMHGPDFIARSMRAGTPACLSSTVMRTAALPEVCFEAGDEVCGDLVLFLRIALDWDVAFLASPGIEFRFHRGQLSKAYDVTDNVRALEDSKLRFLSANSARLRHVAALRRAARGYAATALSRPVSIAAGESRAEGMRALGDAVRYRPQVVIAPRMWGPITKIVVGPRALRAYRHLRSRR
jgi:glycosyltransferase involved in cell wall biosynthesis